MTVFFREIFVSGRSNIPETAPVIFAGNHPNSLIDPVLVIGTCGRQVSFAAKDALFQPPLGYFLRAVGAVPIARKMDHGEGPRDNSGALSALCGVVAAGGAMGIFPEGLSHDQPHLLELRTGAARIALQAAAEAQGEPVHIVPVGLTYICRKRFRTRVMVRYGESLVVRPADLAAFEQDPYEAARTLTDRIQAALREITVNASDWDTLRVLDGVRRLYQPGRITLKERTELTRRFAAYYPTVAQIPEVAALFNEVRDFQERLEDAGLSDRDLVRGLVGRGLIHRGIINLAAVAIWLPLSLPGLPLHLPLLLLIGYFGLLFAPRKDVIGTSRLITGLVGVGLAYLATPLIIGFTAGWIWAVLTACLLPLSGYATLRLLERGISLRRILRSGWASLSLRRHLRELRAERAELSERVIATVQAYKPEDLELLFPRSSAKAEAADVG